MKNRPQKSVINVIWIALAVSFSSTNALSDQLTLVHTIKGDINPKSVVHNGNGLFLLQNMMYLHTVAIYNRSFQRVATIKDDIRPSDFGYREMNQPLRGAPVEAAITSDGKFAWVTNYQMFGKGFDHPGDDRCSATSHCDRSFVYRINLTSYKIDKVGMVGAVPKFVAITPNNRMVLVSNWCSYDLSIVDPLTARETKRIYLGRFPRGIAVSPDSKTAYVALVGSLDVALVNLQTFKVEWIRNVGTSPRHLCINSTGTTLYASLNGEGKISKVDVKTRKVMSKTATGSAPRSMTLTADGHSIYVVNNGSDTVSKVRTDDMKVVCVRKTWKHPIGIAFDEMTKQLWVACYQGQVQIFQD